MVGLTGGVGSGKSTVSGLLASYGAVVVDADLLAREAVAPGSEGLAAVVAAFGPEVLQPDGSLDRPGLGRIVFPDPEALARLNAIVHPEVGRLGLLALGRAREAGSAVVVHDVPLLVENGLQAGYDEVVVVLASEQTRLDRLVRLRGMPEGDARARMAAQASDEQRRAAATTVLDNDGTVEDLTHQVEQLWRRWTA